MMNASTINAFGISAMIFLLAINVFIIGMGAWVTMLDHADMGGTRG